MRGLLLLSLGACMFGCGFDMPAAPQAKIDHPPISDVIRQAGLPASPPRIFIRAFKHEREMEVWAAAKSGQFKFLRTYPIVGMSGSLGPKRREGDRQVPEGIYHVDRFNPNSQYHLSLGLNYPNKADRLLGDPKRPGSDIFIHGSNVSIGCMAMTDEKIEEIYALATGARKAGNRIPVHVFPCRMEGNTYRELRHGHPEHVDLWSQLAPIYKAFGNSKMVPPVTIGDAGKYKLRK